MYFGYRLFFYTVIVLLVLFFILFKFRHLYYPNTPCDCTGESIEWLSKVNPQTQVMCSYRYILRSENFSDCSYFGLSCAQYLAKNDVDCSVEDCGVESMELPKEILKQIEDEKATLSEHGYSDRLELQLEYMAAIAEANPQVGGGGVLGLPEYFSDNGCT